MNREKNRIKLKLMSIGRSSLALILALLFLLDPVVEVFAQEYYITDDGEIITDMVSEEYSEEDSNVDLKETETIVTTGEESDDEILVEEIKNADLELNASYVDGKISIEVSQSLKENTDQSLGYKLSLVDKTTIKGLKEILDEKKEDKEIINPFGLEKVTYEGKEIDKNIKSNDKGQISYSSHKMKKDGYVKKGNYKFYYSFDNVENGTGILFDFDFQIGDDHYHRQIMVPEEGKSEHYKIKVDRNKDKIKLAKNPKDIYKLKEDNKEHDINTLRLTNKKVKSSNNKYIRIKDEKEYSNLLSLEKNQKIDENKENKIDQIKTLFYYKENQKNYKEVKDLNLNNNNIENTLFYITGQKNKDYLTTKEKKYLEFVESNTLDSEKSKKVKLTFYQALGKDKDYNPNLVSWKVEKEKIKEEKKETSEKQEKDSDKESSDEDPDPEPSEEEKQKPENKEKQSEEEKSEETKEPTDKEESKEKTEEKPETKEKSDEKQSEEEKQSEDKNKSEDKQESEDKKEDKKTEEKTQEKENKENTDKTKSEEKQKAPTGEKPVEETDKKKEFSVEKKEEENKDKKEEKKLPGLNKLLTEKKEEENKKDFSESTTKQNIKPSNFSSLPMFRSALLGGEMMSVALRSAEDGMSKSEYDVITDPKATTEGDNNGFYKVDITDFKYFSGIGRGFFGVTAKMKLGIRLPQGAKKGDKFTLKLPEDFRIMAPLNSYNPIIRLINDKDRTQVIATIKYKEGSPENPTNRVPNIRHLKHYLVGEITSKGENLLAKTGFKGDVTFGNTYETSKGEYVDGDRGGKKRYDFGVEILASHWTSDRNPGRRRRNIRKTFYFENSYNGDKDTLKDQSSLIYTNRDWIKQHYGDQGDEYGDVIGMEESFERDNMNQTVDYYLPGDQAKGLVRTVQGNIVNAVRGSESGWFELANKDKIDTNVDDFTIYKVTNNDKQINSYRGDNIQEVVRKKGEFNNNFNDSDFTLSPNGKHIDFRPGVTLYFEQNLSFKPTSVKPIESHQPWKEYSVDNSISGEKFMAFKINKPGYAIQTDQRFFHNVRADAFIEPSREIVIAKIAKEDRDKDGVPENYLIKSSPVEFSLFKIKPGATFYVANRLKTKDGILTLSTNETYTNDIGQKNKLEKGAVYKLYETKVPTGFKKPSDGYSIYFTIYNDDTVRYGFSESELTEKPYGNKLIDGKIVYNGGYIPYEDIAVNKNEFKLKKVDSKTRKGLNDAKFSVINLDTGAMFETYTKHVIWENGFEEDGVIKFTKSELPDGKYKIVEIQAPSGYELPQKDREEIFWVKNGNYYKTDPNKKTASNVGFRYASNTENLKSLENISKAKKDSREKTSKNMFKSFYSAFKPTTVYADGETPDQTYEVGLLKTRTPKITTSPSRFRQVFYVNSNGKYPNTNLSDIVFSIYGDWLTKTGVNSWKKTNTPSSVVINENTNVKVYEAPKWLDGSITLPENPNDFDSSSATEVTNIPIGYDTSTESYQVNLGNKLDNGDCYVIVVEGKIDAESGNPVVTSGALINKKGQLGFPVSILPNSGSVIPQRKGRKKPHLILLKYDIVGIPIKGVEYTVRNNKTGQTYTPTNLDPAKPMYTSIKFGKEIKELPPGVYTITETSVPSQYGVDYELPKESWEITIGSDNTVKLNTESELIKESTSSVNSDYIILDIYNKPVQKPSKLILNLYKQDGKTPLDGGEFTLIDDETGQEINFKTKGNKFTIDLPVDFKSGSYTIKQKTIPTDPISNESYVNNEPQWKITINRDARNGTWVSNLRTDYNYIDYDKSGLPNSFNVFNRLPKEEPTVLLPPAYGDIDTNLLSNVNFTITNTKKDKGKFILKKTDGKYPLAGAIFKLTGITDTQYTKEINLLNKSEIQINNLSKGEYNLTETKAPQGYATSNKMWKIKVLERNNKIVTEIYENGILLAPTGDGTLNKLIVVNKKTGKGKFIVNKQGFDSEHDTTPESLSNVQFNLVKVDEQESPITGSEAFSKTLETNDNGQAVFDGLDKGKYKLTETEAPNGYKKTDKEWIITVDEHGNVTYQEKAPAPKIASSGFRSGLLADEDFSFLNNFRLEASDSNLYPRTLKLGTDKSVDNRNETSNDNGIFDKQVEETTEKGVFNITTTITGKTMTTQVEDTAKPNFIFLLENDNANMGNSSNRAIGDIKNFLRNYKDIDGATFTIVYYSNGSANYLRVKGTSKKIPINNYNNIPNLSTNSNIQTGIWSAFENARSAKNNEKNILIHVGYNMAYDFYDSMDNIKSELTKYDDAYGFVESGQGGYDQAFPNSNHVYKLQNNRSPYEPGFNRIKSSVDNLLQNSQGGSSTTTVVKTIRDATLDDRFDGDKFELTSDVRAEGHTSGVTINKYDGQIIANHLNLGENESYTLKYQLRLKRGYWDNNDHIIGNASVSQKGSFLGHTQTPKVSVEPDNVNIVARIMNPPPDLQSVTFELVDGNQVIESQEVHGNGWTHTFRNKEAGKYQVRVASILPNNKYSANEYFIDQENFQFTLDKIPKVNSRVILRGKNIGFTSADLVLKKDDIERSRYTVYSNDLSKDFIINEETTYDYKVDLENLRTTNSNYKIEKDDEENPKQYTLTFGEKTNLPLAINNPSGKLKFVKFVLVKDGENTGNTITVNAGNNWRDAFMNLPVYENGRKINYSVKIGQVDPQSSSDEISVDTSTGTPIVIQHPTINVKNYKTTGHFEIIKTDKKNNHLSGAIFTLTKLDKSGKELTGPENVFTATSADKTGKLSFNSLSPGKYKLVETKAPNGYVLSKDFWTIIVSDKGKVTVTRTSLAEGKSPEEKFDLDENEPDYINIKNILEGTDIYTKRGNIQVNIIWSNIPENEKQPIIFKIEGYDKIGENYYKLNNYQFLFGYAKDAPLTFKKNELKKSWSGLKQKAYNGGEYKSIYYKVSINSNLSEDWKVHYDYPKGEDKVKITIFKGSASGSNTTTGNTTKTEVITTTGENNTFDIENIKNKIEFTKIDGKDKKTHLAGAEFVLKKKLDTGEYKKVENSEQSSKDTNQKDRGKFGWEKIPDGEYQVWETTAPKDYILRGHVASFKVEKGNIIDIKDKDGNALKGDNNIENFKAEYPHTGGIGTLIFTGIGIAIMGYAMIEYRRKENIRRIGGDRF